MSSIEALANTKPKENAGPRSSNRFDYQINWGLQKLLKLEEGNEDYVMIFDYHDDIVICNSDKDSDYIDFYQIKTKKAGQWAIGALNSPANESDDESEAAKGNGLGKLSKLLSHTKVFQNSRNLYFVTNSFLSKSIFARSENYVRFNQLKPDAIKAIKKKVKEELGDIEESAFDKMVFIQNQMSVDDYEQTLLGTLSKFLKVQFDIVTDVNAVYDTLIGELRKRNNYENEISSKEELIKCKAISHEEFRNYLNTLTLQKGFEELRLYVLNEISGDVNFAERHKITSCLNEIYKDTLNYENEELSNLTSEIRNKMSETDITDDIKGLWDYANGIYDLLMPTYNNYKLHTEFYIKSLILYIYAQDNQRVI